MCSDFLPIFFNASMTMQARHLFEFGPFRLDPAERRLLRDGRVIPLPPKNFDALLLLVESAGHLLEKEELVQRLWPDAIVEEASLAKCIFTLRKALGPGPSTTLFTFARLLTKSPSAQG
jgi:DNA-binding winged helix-turn-helix (wHTH) protein